MQLGDKHREAIRLYLTGMKVVDLCKEIKVSRQSFYTWMQDETFRSEMEKMKNEVEQGLRIEITRSSQKYLSEIERIAFTSKDEKLRFQALQYLLNHSLGKPTSKSESKIEHIKQEKEISWSDVELKVVE